MAAKKKQKRSRKTSNGAPEGFTKVEGAKIAGFWIPDIPGQSLQGVVGDLITKMDDKTGKANSYCHLMLTSDEIGGNVIGQDENKRKRKVEVGSGMIVGVGGAVLLSRLRGREGREVFIRYDGLGDKVKGKNQARLYDVYERS